MKLSIAIFLSIFLCVNCEKRDYNFQSGEKAFQERHWAVAIGFLSNVAKNSKNFKFADQMYTQAIDSLIVTLNYNYQQFEDQIDSAAELRTVTGDIYPGSDYYDKKMSELSLMWSEVINLPIDSTRISGLKEKHNLIVNKILNSVILVETGYRITCEICGGTVSNHVLVKKSKYSDKDNFQVKTVPKGFCSKACKLQSEHPSWTEEEAYLVSIGEIRIGMTKEMAVVAWGKPYDINRTVGSWGIHEQWVYGSRYLYFENGILTSFQD
jgi:hypothetical protein